MSTKEGWKYAAMDFGEPSVMEDTGTPVMLLLFAQSLVFRMLVSCTSIVYSADAPYSGIS